VVGHGRGQAHQGILDALHGLHREVRGVGGLDLGRQGQQDARRFFQHAVILQGGQGGEVRLQGDDLEGQGPGVERIEHHHVAHRGQSQADKVAGAVGDLAVDQIQQQVQIVDRRRIMRQAAWVTERFLGM